MGNKEQITSRANSFISDSSPLTPHSSLGAVVGLFDFLFGKAKSGGSPKKGLKRINITKRFELSGRTGQGSMSKVFQAYDKELGRTVALKVLDKAKTVKFEEKFKLMGLVKPPEGEVCTLLRHENIVTTYEHGLTTDGSPYLVMEWVEGMPLYAWAAQHSPSGMQLCRLLLN